MWERRTFALTKPLLHVMRSEHRYVCSGRSTSINRFVCGKNRYCNFTRIYHTNTRRIDNNNSTLQCSSRYCATVPSVEDVHQAYKVLGIRHNCTYADIKKRYIDLAKEHHPDVVAAKLNASAVAQRENTNNGINNNTDKHNSSHHEPAQSAAHANAKMVEINNAYSTVRQFHKTGQSLPSPQTYSSSSSNYYYSPNNNENSSKTSEYSSPWSQYVYHHNDNTDFNFDNFYNKFVFYDDEWNEYMQSPYDGAFYTHYENNRINKNNSSYRVKYDNNQHNKKGNKSYNSWQNPFRVNNNNNGMKFGQHKYHNNNGGYAPLHEDLDPLMYEMMWEEMRRQNEEEGQDQKREQEEEEPQKQQGKKSEHVNNDSRNINSNNKSETSTSEDNDKNDSKSKTWTAEDMKALIHMYTDGKSFEFIANALSRSTQEIITQFNKWTTHNADSHKHFHQSHKMHHRQRSKNASLHNAESEDAFFNGPYYYYSESPDDIPIDLIGHDREMNNYAFAYNKAHKNKNKKNNKNGNKNYSYKEFEEYINSFDEHDDELEMDEEDNCANDEMLVGFYNDETDGDPYGYAVCEDDFLNFNKNGNEEFVPYNSAMPFNGRMYMSGGTPSHTHRNQPYRQTHSSHSTRRGGSNSNNFNKTSHRHNNYNNKYRDDYGRYHVNNGRGKKLGKKFTNSYKYKPKYNTAKTIKHNNNNSKER